jgi:hypothetical protein
MVDWTRTHFTGLSDEPCSGDDLLAPTSSETGSRRSTSAGVGPLFPEDLGRRFDPPTARGLPSRPPLHQRLAPGSQQKRGEPA